MMHKVLIASTGEAFSLPHNACLLDAAELQLAGLVFGCRAGMCGICAIEVMSGADRLSPREDDEAMSLESMGNTGDTARLACKCRLRGDITIRPCS